MARTLTAGSGIGLTENAGAGTVTVATDLGTSSGSSLVGFIQTGTGATARTVQSELRDFINVLHYGAVADWNGTTGTDNSTAFANAIARAAAIGGATVYVPAGAYKLESSLSITTKGIRIVGDGMYNTTIVKNGTSSLVFSFDNAACDLCEVSDLRITKGTSTHTASFVFQMNTAGALGIRICNVLLEDVYACVGSQPGTLGVNDVVIENCEWLRIEKYGLYVEYGINWFMKQVVIQMNGTTANTNGVVLGSSTEGCRFDSVYVLGGEHSWRFANTLSGTSPKEHTLTHCIGDGGGVTCFYATGLRRSKFIGCWASTQETNARGVVWDGTDVFGIVWTAGEIVNITEDAMQIVNGATRLTISDSIFSNWGIEAATTFYGIQASANSATSFAIVNNHFSDDSDLSGNNTWTGIGINAGTYRSYVVTGNQFQGTTNTVVDSGTASVGKTVSGNH